MADRDVDRNDGDGRAVERSGGAADDWQQPEPSLRIRDKVAGFGVTFLEMFKRPFTEEYPDKGKYSAPQPRFHGRHQLNRHPDGLEKCIGCELCAWACPADAIYVEGADNTEEERFSPGERYGRVYQINYLRCILCGLCIEACPTRALTMTNEYELAGPSRAGLIYEKKDLLGPLLPGMLPAPHPMVPGTNEKDYYRGSVTESVPEQLAWVEARRDPAEDLQTQGARSESGHAGAAVARETARPVASGVTTDVAPGHPQEGAHR